MVYLKHGYFDMFLMADIPPHPTEVSQPQEVTDDIERKHIIQEDNRNVRHQSLLVQTGLPYIIGPWEMWR